MSNITQKALFIWHGSPMNIIAKNDYTDFLQTYVKTIEEPRAIVVISAHRLTKGTYITGAEKPEQIYDFWWFPDELYNIQYAPKGDPELAQQIASDIPWLRVDKIRWVDHAARSVLIHMYPNQNIPVLEMSLDVDKTFAEHLTLARSLAAYRNQNILFLWSWNIVHNLLDISFDENSKPYDRAVELDTWFKSKIEKNDLEALVNYADYLPNYEQGIPTTEHYLPLIYTMWMKLPSDKVSTIHESIQNGSISMRSVELWYWK